MDNNLRRFSSAVGNHVKWTLIALPLLLALTRSGWSASTLINERGDQALVIDGTLDGKTTSFAGTARISLRGEAKSAVVGALPDPLISSQPPAVPIRIEPGNVVVDSNVTLALNEIHDFRITVQNVSRPGIYKGQVKFQSPGVSAVCIQVEARITSKPNVKPRYANLSLQVVRHGRFLPRLHCLLPESLGEDKLTVDIENNGLSVVHLTAGEVILRGDKTGKIPHWNLTPNPTADKPIEIPPGKAQRFILSVSSAASGEGTDKTRRLIDETPDHYTGVCRFTLADSDDPVSVPVNVDVRNEPFFPLVAIVAGIVIGRLVQRLTAPAVQRQQSLSNRLANMQEQARTLRNVAARDHVVRLLQQLKQKIRDTPGDTTLDLEMTKAEQLIRRLLALDLMQQDASSALADAALATVIPAISKARLEAIQGDPNADASFQTADTALYNALAATPATAANKRAMQTMMQRPAPAPAAAAKPYRLLRGSVRVFQFLAGADVPLTYPVYALLSAVGFLLLIVFLTFLGFQTLYVNAGTTFGVGGLYDYIGLVLWGITTDIAQRTLQNLPGPK